MTEKLKKIADEIRRIAAGELDDIPPAAPPATGKAPGATPPVADSGGLSDVWDPNAKAAPRPQGGGGSRWGGGNIDIISMQQALQDLAHTVSAQINLRDVFSGDKDKETEAKARDAFGVFLAKNYMRNNKVQGVEYDPDPNVTDVNKKDPRNPSRISNVMDTMNRIGNPKRGEKFDDGSWGPRTNAAVRNAYVFASGLFDFVNDVNKFSSKQIVLNYSPQQLQEIEPFAQANPNALSPQEKVRAAPTITKNVKAIKAMYENIKNQILHHAAYRQFIEGKNAFKSYTPNVTKEQLDTIKQQFPSGFEINVGDKPTKIPVDSLLNLSTLQEWLKVNAPQVQPQQVVDQIWQNNQKLLGMNPKNDPGY